MLLLTIGVSSLLLLFVECIIICRQSSIILVDEAYALVQFDKFVERCLALKCADIDWCDCMLSYYADLYINSTETGCRLKVKEGIRWNLPHACQTYHVRLYRGNRRLKSATLIVVESDGKYVLKERS